jgi:DNA-binding transcriptional LysR family regulator
MLPILTRCFESAAVAQALAAGMGKGGAVTLRVALSPTIGIKLVLAALQEAERVFEGLELVVRRESAAGTLDLLKTGQVEVAMAAGDILEAQPWLERFPLFDEGYLLISDREHRLANSVGFGLEELRHERIVLSRHADRATRSPRCRRAKDTMPPGRMPTWRRLSAPAWAWRSVPEASHGRSRLRPRSSRDSI